MSGLGALEHLHATHVNGPGKWEGDNAPWSVSQHARAIASRARSRGCSTEEMLFCGALQQGAHALTGYAPRDTFVSIALPCSRLGMTSERVRGRRLV